MLNPSLEQLLEMLHDSEINVLIDVMYDKSIGYSFDNGGTFTSVDNFSSLCSAMATEAIREFPESNFAVKYKGKLYVRETKESVEETLDGNKLRAMVKDAEKKREEEVKKRHEKTKGEVLRLAERDMVGAARNGRHEICLSANSFWNGTGVPSKIEIATALYHVIDELSKREGISVYSRVLGDGMQFLVTWAPEPYAVSSGFVTYTPKKEGDASK